MSSRPLTSVRTVLEYILSGAQSTASDLADQAGRMVDDLSGETERLRQQLAQDKQDLQATRDRAAGVRPIRPDYEGPITVFQEAEAAFLKADSGEDPRPALAALPALRDAAQALAGLRAEHDLQHQAMMDCADWEGAHGATLKQALAAQPEGQTHKDLQGPLREAHQAYVDEMAGHDFVAAKGRLLPLQDKLNLFTTARDDSKDPNRQLMAMRRDTVLKMKADAISGLGGVLPPALVGRFDDLQQITQVRGDIAPDEVDKLVGQSDTLMEALDVEVRGWVDARKTWVASELKLAGAFSLLESHAQANVAPVRAQIDALRIEIEKSRALATDHDYAGANHTTSHLQAALKVANTLADDCARYHAILVDREQRVVALTNPSGHVDVTGRIDAVKKVLDDAKDLANGDTPDYAEALKVLEPLTQQCIDVAWLSNRAEKYSGLRTRLETEIVARKKRQANVTEVGKFLAPMEKAYADSDYATTNDFVKSVSLLESGLSMNKTVKVATKAYSEYVTEVNKADAKLEELKKHAGKAGIKDELDQLQRDLGFARARRQAEEFVTAKNLCVAITAQCAEVEDKADDYEAFLDLKKEVKKLKDAWDPAALPLVAELTPQVAKFEAEAENARVAKDYVLARQQMKRAAHFAQGATAQIKMQKEFGKEVDTARAAGSKADSDFSKAESELNKLLAVVEPQDGDGVYGPEIQAVKDRVEVARLASDPVVGRPELANGEMQGAASDLRDIYYWLCQRGLCISMMDDAQDRLNALVATLSDDALDDEVDTIEQAIEAADTAIDNKQWRVAQDESAKALQLLVQAKKMAQDYNEYEALRVGDIAHCKTQLANTQTTQSMDQERQDFLDDVDEAADLADNEKKFAEALEKLKHAAKAGAIIDKVVDNYIVARNTEKACVTDQLDKAKDKPLVDHIWLKVEQMRLRLAEMFAQRQFVQAGKFAVEIGWKLDEADGIVQADAAYQIEKAQAETAIADVKLVRCAGNEEGLRLAEETLAKAEQAVLARIYPNANKLVASVPAMCVEPLRIGREQVDFDAALQLAQTAVDDLRQQLGGEPAVALQVQELTARIAAAKAQAQGLKLQAAQVVVDGIPALAQAAREAQAQQVQLKESAKTLADAAPDDATGLDEQIDGLKQTLEKLKTHPGAGAIAQSLTTVADSVQAAGEAQADDVPKARAALAQGAAAAAAAWSQASQWAQVQTALKAAADRAGQLRMAHAEPATLLGRYADVDKLLALAREAASRGEFAAALQQLDGIAQDLDMAQAIGEGHAAYVVRRDEAQALVTELSRHANRYAAADELDEAQLQLVQAAQTAREEKPADALKQADEAAALLQVAELKIQMSGNQAIPEAKIKALLARKDGAAELDKIIQQLDPQTQRKACQLALELRFDVKLKQYTDKEGTTEDTADDVPEPNVLSLYEVMRDLPDEHTADNPSLKLIKRLGDAKGTSSFNSGSKEIKLRVGRATDKIEREIGQAWQVGKIDAGCEPVDDVPPRKFSWTTMHEIGHAVDDKLGFMKTNGSAEEYGGWEVHGNDVGKIAAQVAADFGFDVGFTEAYLSDPAAKFLPPEPQFGATPEEWERRRVQVQSWCDSVRLGRKIWYSASETERLTLKNGRVYQEAYANRWVSYKASKRSQGVAGYQFRAPGEWFAELYAAKHTGKINPNHPANQWLDRL